MCLCVGAIAAAQLAQVWWIQLTRSRLRHHSTQGRIWDTAKNNNNHDNNNNNELKQESQTTAHKQQQSQISKRVQRTGRDRILKQSGASFKSNNCYVYHCCDYCCCHCCCCCCCCCCCRRENDKVEKQKNNCGQRQRRTLSHRRRGR